MLAIKIASRVLFAILVAASGAFLCGCTPAAQRALSSGDDALRAGKLPRAIEKLKHAVELMPNEPRAWNLLGIAYHKAGEPQLAAHAYRQALVRDRSNTVSVAHFNLGCLLLEQNNPAAASDELRSFTIITNSAPALVKLGTAQLRLRQLDVAERSFAAALRLQPNDPEALNNLGVLNAQRNRTREAAQFFAAASQSRPDYAPALLNAAVLAQQNAATRPVALEKYRNYLALKPRPANWKAINTVVRELETELAAPRTGAPTNIVVQTPPAPKTNVIVAATNVPAPSHTTNAAARIAVAPPSMPRTASPPAVITNPVVVARTSPPPASVPVTVVSVTTAPPVQVATVKPNVPVPVAGTVIQTNVLQTAAPPSSETAASLPPEVRAEEAEKSKKTGLLGRLNPFRNKPKTAPADAERVVTAPPAAATSPSPPIVQASALKPVFPRYAYLNPPRPVSGQRKEAEQALRAAVKAHRAGSTNDALREYQRAIAADASLFEAQYNYALLAFHAGDFRAALRAWENVLAIEPESINARYNFALTLKQADYIHDAANELEKVLQGKPQDGRAHLMLANIYAQQLQETGRAREHYLKVLELDPRNAQAAAIRFWLAANP